MTTTDLEYHPYANIFPMISQPELQALARDIKENGQQVPIYLYEGKILDGRNRYAACKLAGVEPNIIDWRPEGQDSPLTWVISLNLHRRHLTPSQRAVVAVEILPIFERDALERKSLGGKHKQDFASVISGPIGQARTHAKALMGVNHRYISIVKLLKADAPDLYVKVRDGELVATEAEAVLKGRRMREANLARLSRLRDMPEDERCKLLVGDFREVLHGVPDNSVDMILTDPPYLGEYLDVWEPLSRLGERVLKPGGVLVSYSGHYWLGDVIMALKSHLSMGWVFCLRMSGGGGTRLMRHNKIATCWKPLIMVYKAPYKQPDGVFSDMIDEAGFRDKQYHEWQQGEVGVSKVMQQFTDREGLVIDPFLGGGTTAVVARDLGRRFVGCDISEEAVNLTRARLQETTPRSLP